MRLGLSLSLVCCLALVGCRAPLQVDLAPDGKSVAMATSSHLAINPVGDALEKIIYRGETSHPKWSPDGRRLAFYGNGLVRIFDLGSNRTTPLPGHLGPPFGWNGTGSELLAFNKDKGQQQVYHLASGEVVRSVELPFAPTEIAVASQGRGFAVASSDSICIWKDGRLETIQVEGDVVALTYSSDGLAWLLSAPSEGEKDQRVHLVKWDAATGERSGTEFDLRSLLDSEGKLAWPASLQFSPDGEVVGILGLVDRSPDWVVSKLMEVEDSSSREAQLLMEQVRLGLVFASVKIESGKRLSLHRFSEGASPVDWWQIAWSQNGETAAIVSGRNLKVVPGLK
jgi:hypothetical protein